MKKYHYVLKMLGFDKAIKYFQSGEPVFTNTDILDAQVFYATKHDIRIYVEGVNHASATECIYFIKLTAIQQLQIKGQTPLRPIKHL